MAFCELKYFSPALGKMIAANIVLPEGDFAPPFPVFYLLHGLGDDHTVWMRRTSIERYVQNLPLMVVMPDSGRGFYTDAKEGMAWETSIVRDLMNFVDSRFQTIANREGRVLGGLSMGGYGAAKLALKYPEKFCSAVSHSGALHFGHETDTSRYDPAMVAEWRRVLGDDPVNGPDDLYALAERCDPKNRPALRIDCGVNDFLIEHNRAFHARLTQIAVPHEYEEFSGAHTWDYWDDHVQDAIAFHKRALNLE